MFCHYTLVLTFLIVLSCTCVNATEQTNDFLADLNDYLDRELDFQPQADEVKSSSSSSSSSDASSSSSLSEEKKSDQQKPVNSPLEPLAAFFESTGNLIRHFMHSSEVQVQQTSARYLAQQQKNDVVNRDLSTVEFFSRHLCDAWTTIKHFVSNMFEGIKKPFMHTKKTTKKVETKKIRAGATAKKVTTMSAKKKSPVLMKKQMSSSKRTKLKNVLAKLLKKIRAKKQLKQKKMAKKHKKDHLMTLLRAALKMKKAKKKTALRKKTVSRKQKLIHLIAKLTKKLKEKKAKQHKKSKLALGVFVDKKIPIKDSHASYLSPRLKDKYLTVGTEDSLMSLLNNHYSYDQPQNDEQYEDEQDDQEQYYQNENYDQDGDDQGYVL